MYHVIKLGADSDTNGCIVGSMIGALHGIENIPQEWIDKTRTFNHKRDGGHARPEKYHPKKLDNYIKWLFNRNKHQ